MEQMLDFLSQINIATASRATLYRLQKAFANPVIWVYWKEMQMNLMDRLRLDGNALTVTGDGQVGLFSNAIISSQIFLSLFWI
jgi:hypothetical protein